LAASDADVVCASRDQAIACGIDQAQIPRIQDQVDVLSFAGVHVYAGKCAKGTNWCVCRFWEAQIKFNYFIAVALAGVFNIRFDS
jgi:hypothetical protein